MSTPMRLGVIVAALVVAVIAFVLLKQGSHSSQQASNPTASAPGGHGAPQPAPVQITVKGGKPVGGIKTIAVKKDAPVRFVVHSDVADEIHVHGYNFKKDVRAGGRVSFDFPAKIDGIFVIELESRSQQIASLKVQP
jgi:heme/copper-type cytochrome/quinol oxidase subunit 2